MISHLAYVSCDECQNCRPDRPACPLCGEPARWYYDSRVYWHCLVPVPIPKGVK